MATFLLPNSTRHIGTYGDVHAGPGQIGRTAFIQNPSNVYINQTNPGFNNEIRYRYIFSDHTNNFTFELGKIGTTIEPGYSIIVVNVGTDEFTVREDNGTIITTVPINNGVFITAKSAGVPDIWEVSSFTGGSLTANFVFVDGYGDDSTGVVGRIDAPFRTLNGAFAAASDGDVLYLFPGGNFNATSALNNVAVDIFYSVDTISNFTTITLPAGCNVYGYGILRCNTGVNICTDCEYFQAENFSTGTLLTTSANTNIEIKYASSCDIIIAATDNINVDIGFIDDGNVSISPGSVSTYVNLGTCGDTDITYTGTGSIPPPVYLTVNEIYNGTIILTDAENVFVDVNLMNYGSPNINSFTITGATLIDLNIDEILINSTGTSSGTIDIQSSTGVSYINLKQAFLSSTTSNLLYHDSPTDVYFQFGYIIWTRTAAQNIIELRSIGNTYIKGHEFVGGGAVINMVSDAPTAFVEIDSFIMTGFLGSIVFSVDVGNLNCKTSYISSIDSAIINSAAGTVINAEFGLIITTNPLTASRPFDIADGTSNIYINSMDAEARGFRYGNGTHALYGDNFTIDGSFPEAAIDIVQSTTLDLLVNVKKLTCPIRCVSTSGAGTINSLQIICNEFRTTATGINTIEITNAGTLLDVLLQGRFVSRFGVQVQVSRAITLFKIIRSTFVLSFGTGAGLNYTGAGTQTIQHQGETITSSAFTGLITNIGSPVTVGAFT